jgi:hypothetical protein
MSGEAGRRGASRWRAASFLLLALVLVQADAHPPGAALRRFHRERVLPVALDLHHRAEEWLRTQEIARLPFPLPFARPPAVASSGHDQRPPR